MELENIIYPGFNKTLSELNALSKVKKKSCEIVDLTEIEWVRDVLRHRVEEIGSYDIKFRKPTKEEIQTVSKIVGAVIITLGLASQYTLDASGNRIEKKRVTHDASMPPHSNHSLNEDTLDDLLAPCIYGTCLRRITHAIHSMRLHFPKIPIIISKSDLNS